MTTQIEPSGQRLVEWQSVQVEGRLKLVDGDYSMRTRRCSSWLTAMRTGSWASMTLAFSSGLPRGTRWGIYVQLRSLRPIPHVGHQARTNR